MSKNWSGRKSRFQGIKSGTCFLTKNEQSLILSEAGEWNSDIQKIVDELMLEVCKAKEWLYILYLSWFGPILDNLYFVSSHGKAFRRQDVAQVFDSVAVELTFLGLSIQPFPELLEYFFNLVMVSGFIRRVDKNIVKVDNNTNIEHVHEDVVHEVLESSGCIGQAKGHHHLTQRIHTWFGMLSSICYHPRSRWDSRCATDQSWYRSALYLKSWRGWILAILLGKLVEPLEVNAEA